MNVAFVSTGAGIAAAAFWLFIAVIIVAGMWYDMRRREAQHETLRRLAESGQPLDPDLMDRLLSVSGGGNTARELMIWGVVMLFVAPGVAVLAVFIGWQYAPALLPLLGVAILIGFIGVGLVVASRFVERRPDASDEAPANRHAA